MERLDKWLTVLVVIPLGALAGACLVAAAVVVALVPVEPVRYALWCRLHEASCPVPSTPISGTGVGAPAASKKPGK